MGLKEYRIINVVMMLLLSALFLYAAFYQPTQSLAINCQYKALTGKNCPSCGLTRGIALITQGNIKAAQQLNPNSLKIFLFFVIQFIVRSVLAIFAPAFINRRFIIADAVISTLMVLFAFGNLLLWQVAA